MSPDLHTANKCDVYTGISAQDLVLLLGYWKNTQSAPSHPRLKATSTQEPHTAGCAKT
jgi:hypothetical protein